MKFTRSLPFAAVALALFAAGSYAQTPDITAFNGIWTLDRNKTNITRNFPEKLKDFKMQIGSDQDKLVVKQEVVGDLEITQVDNQAPAPIIMRAPALSNAGNSGAGAVAATSGVGGGPSTAPRSQNFGGTYAIRLSPP